MNRQPIQENRGEDRGGAVRLFGASYAFYQICGSRSVVAMNNVASQLIEAARAVCGEFPLRDDFSAGSVGAAILTDKGNVYTGVCIDLACGLGFCAEVAAVAEMLKHRERRIAAIVAVAGDKILSPCGRCREMIAQVDARNLDCDVIVGKERTVSLRALLPDHWLTDARDTEESEGRA